jgi:hypothetical protein
MLFLQRIGQHRDRLLFVRAHILLAGFGVDHQQVERHVQAVIEIDHPRAASLTRPFARPAYLSDAAGTGNSIASQRVAGDMVDKGFTFLIIPDFLGLSHESRGFDNRDENRLRHRVLYVIVAHAGKRRRCVNDVLGKWAQSARCL